MLIGRKDLLWNYASTILKISASAFLLPLILKMMPSEMVAIWSVFITITAFSELLDFGFNPSFTRNVTYILSGVKTLKVNGFESVINPNQIVDYSLLKGLIIAMRWFYLRTALILLLLFLTIGTYYIHNLLLTYQGNHLEIYIAWFLLCFINTYNLFTLYYDSLLQGKGLIKKSKQIQIIGQVIYLLIAALFILFGFGLIAIISAQAASVIIIRWLSYKTFFTTELKGKLKNLQIHPQQNIIKKIYPNAFKIGLTSLGSFMVTKSAILIGSMYLSLDAIASYGISFQLIAVIGGMATIYVNTFQPKIDQLRIKGNNFAIKELYLKGKIVLLFTYLIGGLTLIIFGEKVFIIIGSRTQLLSHSLILAAIIVSFLGSNHGIAGLILLSKNEVPFFKASLISGCVTIILLLLLFYLIKPSLWIMIAGPGIVQAAYQNWKWPRIVNKELEVTQKDRSNAFSGILNFKFYP